MRWTSALGPLLFLAAPALAQDAGSDPLAVIDWLSKPPQSAPEQVLRTPVAEPYDEPAVSDSAARPEVQVLPLDAATPDAVGLLPPGVTGFPLDLWKGTGLETLEPLILALDTQASPSMQRLVLQLLLAEANPPLGLPEPGAFLALRAKKLESIGAVDPALALLERAGTTEPALFDVYFDLALLSDQTDAACNQLAAAPYLSRAYAPRVFCLARAGDWQAAATTRNTAAFLGALTDTDALLLELFLDPELAEELDPPERPRTPSPLEVRLFEALGTPIAPGDLPLGHAVRDLSGDAGWKGQITAAERLAAQGALPPARLFGIYGLRKRSASGGVWERVSGFQRLQSALDEGRDVAAGAALLSVWPLMRDARLDGAFAAHMAPALLNANLSGAARDRALDVAFLSGLYESAAATLVSGERAFTQALATGDGSAMTDAARTQTERAIASAFEGRAIPPVLERLRGEGKLGEVILRATALYLEGQTGDPRDAADAIAAFRAVGLEDIARRAGLELIYLDRGA